MFFGEKTELFRRRKGGPAGLSDPRLLEGLLDLGLLEPHDNFVADDQDGSRPSPGFLGQLFQVLRIFDYVFFDERNPFLREKLPRRLAGVSGRVEVNDDWLSHDSSSSEKVSGSGFRVSGSKMDL
jgi:hypothetical protein